MTIYLYIYIRACATCAELILLGGLKHVLFSMLYSFSIFPGFRDAETTVQMPQQLRPTASLESKSRSQEEHHELLLGDFNKRKPWLFHVVSPSNMDLSMMFPVDF